MIDRVSERRPQKPKIIKEKWIMKTPVMSRRFCIYSAKAVFALNDFPLSTYISTPSGENRPICISLNAVSGWWQF